MTRYSKNVVDAGRDQVKYVFSQVPKHSQMYAKRILRASFTKAYNYTIKETGNSDWAFEIATDAACAEVCFSFNIK